MCFPSQGERGRQRDGRLLTVQVSQGDGHKRWVWPRGCHVQALQLETQQNWWRWRWWRCEDAVVSKSFLSCLLFNQVLCRTKRWRPNRSRRRRLFSLRLDWRCWKTAVASPAPSCDSRGKHRTPPATAETCAREAPQRFHMCIVRLPC